MKRTLYTPIPFLFGLLLAGCQEQVAPELSNPAASGSGSSTTSTPTQSVPDALKNFSVVLEGLNASGVHPHGMIIHKANETASVECKVSNVTDTPDAVTPARDISCLIEAEEFALYFNGVSMKAVAGPQTCNYIDVQPFTFWRYMPGVTGRFADNGTNITITPRKVIFYSCDDTTKQFNPTQAVAGTIGGVTHSGLITVSDICDKYVNIDLNGVVDTVFSTYIPSVKLTQADLCSFNFKDDLTQKAYNCDEGSYLLTKVNITSTPIIDATGTVTGASLPVFTASPAEETKCGGKAVACKSGPGVEYVGENAYQLGFRSRINPMPTTGGSAALNLAAPFAKNYFSNKFIANFMYQQSGNTTTSAASPPLPFSLPVSFQTGIYNPTRIEDYSRNRTYVTIPTSQEKDKYDMDVVYLAEDAFRGGLHRAPAKYVSNYITHPVYTFTCFDSGLDIKARIRVSIREWDRTFSTSSPVLKLISDLYKNPEDRLLHANGIEQISGGGEVYLPFADYNDIKGWDDFFEMCDVGAGSTVPCSLINGVTTGPGLESTALRRNPASFPGDGL